MFAKTSGGPSRSRIRWDCTYAGRAFITAEVTAALFAYATTTRAAEWIADDPSVLDQGGFVSRFGRRAENWRKIRK